MYMHCKYMHHAKVCRVTCVSHLYHICMHYTNTLYKCMHAYIGAYMYTYISSDSVVHLYDVLHMYPT